MTSPRDFSQYGTDLRLIFREGGGADISWTGGDLDTVRGLDNLAQALTLRILVRRGELAELAHPRFGSRVHELIGAPLDRASLDLLRRHVQIALRGDPRVDKVLRVAAAAIPAYPGAVQVRAVVRARTGEITAVELALDLT